MVLNEFKLSIFQEPDFKDISSHSRFKRELKRIDQKNSIIIKFAKKRIQLNNNKFKKELFKIERIMVA